MTLSELQAQREGILAKIGAAERRLQIGDMSVENFGMTELRDALALVDQEIAQLNNAGASRVFTIQTSRGFS